MSDDLLLPGVEPSAAPQPAPGRGGYREKQSVYAERYGTAVRTIKLWINEGRAKENPPPLDDPLAMPEWWIGLPHRHRVPDGILAAAGRARSNDPLAPPPPAPPPAQKSAPAGVPPAPSPVVPHATGYSATLERLRTAEAEAFAVYEAAKKPGDDGKVDKAAAEQARRAWNDISEQLRFQEKSAAEILGKSGEMLARDEIKRMLVELHGPIVAGLRSLFNRVRTKAGNVPLDQARPHFEAETKRLLNDLCTGPFAPAAA